MKTLKLSLLTLISITLISCYKHGPLCIKSNGDIQLEKRDHVGFNEISLKTSANVYFVQEKEYSVRIEASENLMPVLETKVENEVLKIQNKKNTCIKNHDPINIYISGPEINGVHIYGSGDIFIEDAISTDYFELTISGSGDINVSEIKTKTIDASISGSGNIYVAGTETVTEQNNSITGSGNINTMNLSVKNSTTKITGSGDCKLNIIKDLDVRITGSGSVIYKGNPIINSDITGSGSLKHI